MSTITPATTTKPPAPVKIKKEKKKKKAGKKQQVKEHTKTKMEVAPIQKDNATPIVAKQEPEKKPPRPEPVETFLLEPEQLPEENQSDQWYRDYVATLERKFITLQDVSRGYLNWLIGATIVAWEASRQKHELKRDFIEDLTISVSKADQCVKVHLEFTHDEARRIQWKKMIAYIYSSQDTDTTPPKPKPAPKNDTSLKDMRRKANVAARQNDKTLPTRKQLVAGVEAATEVRRARTVESELHQCDDYIGECLTELCNQTLENVVSISKTDHVQHKAKDVYTSNLQCLVAADHVLHQIVLHFSSYLESAGADPQQIITVATQRAKDNVADPLACVGLG